MKIHNIREKSLILIILISVFGFILSSCNSDSSKTYQDATIYLDCENYSAVENDPGNCRVISGTTDGLRIQLGLIVTKDYVEGLMSDLGWKKENHTNKYIDYNGQSFRVEVYKFSRVLED
jgi:hypothetical protein